MDDRKGFQRIRIGAKSGRFDVLLVYMLDRLGRNPEEMKTLINELLRQGIVVCQSLKERLRSSPNRKRNNAHFLQLAIIFSCLPKSWAFFLFA
ncbi:recombinase family protein [Bacillus sp. FJAT-18017]|uniref:recombinase family protein n=1 Tax=Bacillus sp. FJAT-18017 TaxID=1705566 RepID=UPI0009EC1F51